MVNLILACILFVLLGINSSDAATTITFDDLADQGITPTGIILPNGYFGFDWNFGIIDPIASGEPFATSGYSNGIVSGSYVGFLFSGPSSFSRATPFSLVSAYLTAAWKNNVRVLVSGYREGVLVHQIIIFVDSLSPTYHQFNFAGVDLVTFGTSGGIDAGYGGSGSNVAVDNMVVSILEIIDINIKPGSYPNCININGNGVIPVAILGSADFDVTQIDRGTLEFEGLNVRVKGNGDPQCAVDDVSGDFASPEGAPDGYPDLVCQFVDDPDTWSPAHSSGFSGSEIQGRTDSLPTSGFAG